MIDLSSGNRDGDEMNGNVLSVIACMYSSGFVPVFRHSMICAILLVRSDQTLGCKNSTGKQTVIILNKS
jgi:hypothetical protein